jgi:hypothetical protein
MSVSTPACFWTLCRKFFSILYAKPVLVFIHRDSPQAIHLLIRGGREDLGDHLLWRAWTFSPSSQSHLATNSCQNAIPEDGSQCFQTLSSCLPPYVGVGNKLCKSCDSEGLDWELLDPPGSQHT